MKRVRHNTAPTNERISLVDSEWKLNCSFIIYHLRKGQGRIHHYTGWWSLVIVCFLFGFGFGFGFGVVVVVVCCVGFRHGQERPCDSSAIFVHGCHEKERSMKVWSVVCLLVKNGTVSWRSMNLLLGAWFGLPARIPADECFKMIQMPFHQGKFPGSWASFMDSE